MKHLAWTIPLLIALGFVAAQATVRDAAAANPSASPATRPYLIHLSGVAGPRGIDRSLIRGLRAGDVDAEINVYDWTCEDGGLHALWARERNQKQAKIVADLITDHYRADPTQKIYITSHSGGTAIAAWALELLPEDVKVDNILFLASGLSPGYDLSKSLAHVRGRVDYLFSPNDGIVLGYGTRAMGTMDGIRCDAAGKVGFKMPTGADAHQYEKLIAHPYQVGWYAKYGNSGDHIGMMDDDFARDILAPMLLGKTPATQPTTRP